MSIDESLLEKVRETAYKHALLNAYKHGGKADLKAVLSKIIGEIPEIRSSVRLIIDDVKKIIDEVNSMDLETQRRIIEKNWPDQLVEKREREEKKLPPLPNAEMGKVVTRLAPNPDYTIHLGNARPALLSYWYAEMYDGRMILRFEDTDPRTKAPFPEAYDKIKDDLKWLGVKWSEEYIQSIRLPIFYKHLYELIKRNGAYVDKCSGEEFRKYRLKGVACPHRDLDTSTHLEELDKILEGHYGEGEAVVRVKTDMKHQDPSVRDWVAFRIIDTSKTPHPVTGDRYILWPTYNFAAAVDDHVMGVTHILRAKEHVTNTVKQKYLYDHMGWKYPETIHFGRLSLEGIILSKSRMRKMIREYGMEPYDDPRFGTLSGLRRRGIVRETIWEIVKQVGVKSIDARVSYVNLAAINRSIIDPLATRYMAVEKPTPLFFNLDEDFEAHVPRHPDRGVVEKYVFEKGENMVYISSEDYNVVRDKLFRLMGFANMVIEKLVYRDGYMGFQAVVKSFDPEDARRADAPIIQWIHPRRFVKTYLRVPAENRLETRILYAEENIVSRSAGDLVQFYRIGFARIDRVSDNAVECIYAHD